MVKESDKIFCPICFKEKPPIEASPYSFECDAGYKIITDCGRKIPGYCDSKRLGLPWPPFKREKKNKKEKQDV